MPSLDRDAEVFVLDLGDDENRFNPPWAGEVTELLDEVASTDGPRALVTKATGRRYGGMDAAAAGIVDDVVGEDAVLAAAVERARALVGKAGDTLGAIKTQMYERALGLLRAPRDLGESL